MNLRVHTSCASVCHRSQRCGPTSIDSAIPIPPSNIDFEIYETIGEFLRFNEDTQFPWFDSLKEACYAMAADCDLQRYFMSDYYSICLNYGDYYELWIGGGKLFFDDGRCLVSPVQRR